MANQKQPRYEIAYLDGVNTQVGDNLAKRNELSFCRNARSQVIGVIEKRQGYDRLGGDLSATANYGLHYFEDTNSLSDKFYRVSNVSSVISIYYLNTSSSWTSLGSPLSPSASPSYSPSISPSASLSPSNSPSVSPSASISPSISPSVSPSGSISPSASISSSASPSISPSISPSVSPSPGSGTSLSAASCHFVTAENCAFMVNGVDANRYIESNGTSVVTSATAEGHLYNSPIARKINYYKGRLYLADYLIGSTRYQNKVMRSSPPAGIISLLDGDNIAADCVGDKWIKVTDTKYIYATDTIDIYRGGSKVADITVKAKTEDTFQINAITFVGSFTTLDSADEVWLDGTYTGTRVFRWPDNASSGSAGAKQYDTFTVADGDNDALNMMTNIGGVMIMANDNNLATWNDSSLETMDYGIGCVSERGYVKSNGVLFFVHYNGVYATTGSRPQLMSAKVEQYFTGATKAGLAAAAAGKKGNSVFFSIGNVTLYNEDGSTYKSLVDVVLEYNLRQENWFIHTDISVDQFQTMIGSTDPDRLMLSDADDFNIYEFLSGTSDRGTTSNLPIFFDITSKKISMGENFESIVYPKYLIVEILRGSGIEAFIALDDDDFYSIGEANKGVTIIPIISRQSNSFETTPRCRKLKISLRESSIYLCKIGKIAVVYGSVSDEEITHE